mgnify:CR=1 FL=1
MRDHTDDQPKSSEELVAVARTGAKPTWAQTRYLLHGLKEPGGKLPLFDKEGQQIDVRTIRSCIEKGWVKPWFKNPIKPDWLVCRLTAAGYKVLGADKPKAC